MSLEVELQVFDGPLDLLLQLIEKNKINIFDIPIVEITDQYLSYVQKMEEEDLGVMSEFMVMAATLISIKSIHGRNLFSSCWNIKHTNTCRTFSATEWGTLPGAFTKEIPRRRRCCPTGRRSLRKSCWRT